MYKIPDVRRKYRQTSDFGGDTLKHNNPRRNQRLRPWEIALLLALAVTLGAAVWADRRQASLADGVIRLHVIANSDSEADQAAKLTARDRVLDTLTPLLAGCRSRGEAARVIEAAIPALEADGVRVTLGEEYYPTRAYDGFALPAGRYLSLRVVLGAGEGHNWWCVVFPPLCTEALAEDASDAFLSLDDGDAALITQQTPAYELRFRVLEWWGVLKNRLTSEDT